MSEQENFEHIGCCATMLVNFGLGYYTGRLAAQHLPIEPSAVAMPALITGLEWIYMLWPESQADKDLRGPRIITYEELCNGVRKEKSALEKKIERAYHQYVMKEATIAAGKILIPNYFVFGIGMAAGFAEAKLTS